MAGTTVRTAAPPIAHKAPRWLDYAACRGEDPEIFFPVSSSGAESEQLASAKRVCAGCPVRGECLEWALATNQASGVWGGTSEGERRALRRRRVLRAASTTRTPGRPEAHPETP